MIIGMMLFVRQFFLIPKPICSFSVWEKIKLLRLPNDLIMAKALTQCMTFSARFMLLTQRTLHMSVLSVRHLRMFAHQKRNMPRRLVSNRTSRIISEVRLSSRSTAKKWLFKISLCRRLQPRSLIGSIHFRICVLIIRCMRHRAVFREFKRLSFQSLTTVVASVLAISVQLLFIRADT